MRTGVVRVKPMRRSQVDIVAIPRFVRASGFVPGRMNLSAWGFFATDERRFRIRNWHESYPLEGSVENVGAKEVRLLARVNYSSSRAVLAVESSGGDRKRDP